MRIIICLYFFLITPMAFAQQKGIDFRHYENWEEVLAQAKKENKFIFVDAYTTWCVPCKVMTNEIFPREDVGIFMNANFISVKVQMDSTKFDTKRIKNWYDDAANIASIFQVVNYPTLLYFDPKGKLVHRTVGLAGAEDFIKNSSNALNPTTQYLSMQEKFYRGEKLDASFLKDLTTAAWNASDKEKSKVFADRFFSAVDDQQLLTTDNIRFATMHTQRTTDPGFQFFIRNLSKIDSVVGKGTAFSTINWYMSKDVEELVSSYPEMPDWSKIYIAIKRRFPEYADELIIKRKIKYHMEKFNWAEVDRNVSLLLPVYGTMLSENELNGYAYSVFLNCNIEKYLKNALKWTDLSISTKNDNSAVFTKASLLYKLGRTKQAISILEQAVAISDEEDREGMFQILKMMRNGKKIWNEN